MRFRSCQSLAVIISCWLRTWHVLRGCFSIGHMGAMNMWIQCVNKFRLWWAMLLNGWTDSLIVDSMPPDTKKGSAKWVDAGVVPLPLSGKGTYPNWKCVLQQKPVSFGGLFSGDSSIMYCPPTATSPQKFSLKFWAVWCVVMLLWSDVAHW